jgi:transporter family-2 protein
MQAGVNARLRDTLGSPYHAAFVSLLVGTLALAAVALFDGAPLPRSLPRVPWWAWTGGFVGAYVVTNGIVAAPRIGALAFSALLVTGQLVMVLALDHFGWIDFREVPVTPARALGVLFLAVGVYLVLPRAS